MLPARAGHSGPLAKAGVLTSSAPPRLSKPDVVQALRGLIESGAYLPGQALRQEELATRLGVSRVPIREALQLLLAEGIVRHTPNLGFTLARLTASELEQVYTMRRRAETFVLTAIQPDSVTTRVLEELRRTNDELRARAESTDVTGFQRLNQRFHYAMFELPGLDVFEDQINRLWRISGPYRSVWVSDANHRRLVTAEHESMIEALAAMDLPRLCALMDVHRGTTARDIGLLLDASTRRGDESSPR